MHSCSTFDFCLEPSHFLLHVCMDSMLPIKPAMQSKAVACVVVPWSVHAPWAGAFQYNAILALTRQMVLFCPAAKWKNAVVEIKRMHKSGRPVLVGTTSVERSEILADMLRQVGDPLHVMYVDVSCSGCRMVGIVVPQAGRGDKQAAGNALCKYLWWHANQNS